MGEPARHLRVVDEDGALVSGDAGELIQNLEDQLAGAEKDIAAWRTRFFNLKRDKDKEAREHELFPTAKGLFDEWREVCNHPRSDFTPDRFWAVLPFLENPKYGEALCRRAILGAAFDPFVKRRKNGTAKRFDDWDLIFRNADKFEEFCNKAPLNQGGNDGGNDDDPPAASSRPGPGQ